MGRVFTKGIVISVGLLVALLIGNAWLDYRTTRQLNEAAAWVSHTEEVMVALEAIASTIKDAQTGERGYIITGDNRYLEPYNTATAIIDEKMQRLQQLTADNPRQQARIPSLQQRIQDELAILKRNIALEKEDAEAARRAVVTDEGKKAMDAIRLQVGEMEQEERDLLNERKLQYSSSYRVAVSTGMIAALLGLGMTGTIVLLLRRDLLARAQAEGESRFNEARLQALVQLDKMTGASEKEITNFALESAVALTNSKIGYLAFLNDDETVLTMHSWSKTAMRECAITDKPLVYPVVTTGLWGEAVRQRKPVITNDYAAPNPLKKGYPEGHVHVLRHMNAPSFEGDRIVIVAGVGNKAAPYDDSDVRQLTLLMQGVWRLLQRKRQEEEIRRARDELEVRVQERTAELAQANVQLSLAKDVAIAANRAKSTFLANMSHEIRTPMNAVIGMTELVLKSPLSARQREFLMTVKDSGEALLTVINDILDFSKIEAGKLTLDSSTFNLRENLGDTMKSFALRAHQQGLELTCFIHPEVPSMVVGDYGRLRQIVVNLVGNAIKFTEAGDVSLEVSLESHSEKDAVLHFTVSDTGIGIPAEKQATIFEMFEQVDASTRRRHGGTGLGLAIATRLIAMMDGRIWLESEVGQGSRFHFIVRLRLAEGEPTEPVAPEPATLHGMRVLAVDDNATNRRILDEVMKSWKMAPATASNAVDAMNMLQQAQEAGTPYRLVITDAHMPHIDGFMLAQQIKQKSSLSSTVIMMLTSGDRPEDIARCDQLGIAAYLLKPVKQSELLEAIELALGIMVSREELRRATAQQAYHVRDLNVLLAEDSLVNQKLAVALLEEQGHTVTVVSNGKEAIVAAASQTFDLVLMDVQMPEMDGLEATAQIRAWEQQTGSHLPIIAMTAYALKGDRENCLEAGMDNYVAKPIRAEELFEAIDAVLPDRIREAPPDSAIAQNVVDWVEALKVAQGNPAILKTLTEAALEELPRLMRAIREAIPTGNRANLRLAAHTLKGSMGYFGAKEVCEYAAKLEDMGAKGQLADAEATFTDLEAEIARLLAVLSEHLRELGLKSDTHSPAEMC